MSKQNEMKPGKNGYKIYFNTNTVVMNYKFAELAGKYGTKEYNIMKGMAGVFSQLELAMCRARVRSGMANAKAKGKQIGRPQTTKDSIPAIFLRHYPAYKNGQLNITELSRVCDLSRTTIYKYISLLES